MNTTNDNAVTFDGNETMTVGRDVERVWVKIGGLTIQIMRDGWDAEPLISVDAWDDNAEPMASPKATLVIDAPDSIDR